VKKVRACRRENKFRGHDLLGRGGGGNIVLVVLKWGGRRKKEKYIGVVEYYLEVRGS